MGGAGAVFCADQLSSIRITQELDAKFQFFVRSGQLPAKGRRRDPFVPNLARADAAGIRFIS